MSHVAENATALAEVKARLADLGVDGFLAHDDIEPTRVWASEIRDALETCEALAAFNHPGFAASPWTNQEVGFALARGMPVVSVRMGEDPPAFLASQQAIAGTEKSAGVVAQRLFDVLESDPRTAPAVLRGCVAAFEDSAVYDDAVRLSKMLEARAQRLTSGDVDRLRRALESNSTCGNAWWVPDRIDRIANAVGV